jgi:hypothetical protein
MHPICVEFQLQFVTNSHRERVLQKHKNASNDLFSSAVVAVVHMCSDSECIT